MWSLAGQLIGLIAVVGYPEVEAVFSSAPPAEAESSSSVGAEAEFSASASAETADGSEFTDLPPRVGLTLNQIRNTRPHPRCLRDEYPTDLVWQAYYVQSHRVGCVVAWLADTGFSARYSGTSIDLYRISVKRSEPQDGGPDWLPLGGGFWDAIFPFDFDEQALIRLSMAVDRYGYPVIAWVNFVYHPYYTNHLRVRRWDGQAWVNMGDVLNLDRHASASKPLLEWGEDERLFVSWTENKRHRALWTGEQWVLQ